MYSIIDIECNGGKFGKERIIDIAIYRFDGYKIIDSFASLINPEDSITSFVQKLTNISEKMVKTAPKFHEIAKKIIQITENSTLVGHDVNFDYRILKQSFLDLGYNFEINLLDTLPLSKILIPEMENYNLKELSKNLNIPLLQHHRASDDALATLELLKILLKKDTENLILKEQKRQTFSKNNLHRIKELTENLPTEKGIIYLQNKNGKILHSEHTPNIQKTANKILTSIQKKWEKIQNECQQIHYKIIHNPLTALLILQSEKINDEKKFPYGLFLRNQNEFFIKKNLTHSEETPLLLLNSFSQGKKIIHHISNSKIFPTTEDFLQKIELKNRNEIWTSQNYKSSEKTFILIQNGEIIAFGFYEHFHQISSMKKINLLKIEGNFNQIEIKNEMQLSLLRQDFKINPFPNS